MPVGAVVAGGLHHDGGRDGEPDHGQDRRDPVAAVEDVHRVLVFLAADEEDRDDGGEEAEGADDEREEDPGLGVGPAGADRDVVDRDAQDHGADVLGGGGLEQVRAAAGAVADVVADEVRDDARVAGIVLGDALLDLADEVGADVSGLGVDAAAQLGEQGDEGGAEAEADDEEGRLATVRRGQAPNSVKMPHAEQRSATTRKPGDGAAAHRDLDRLDEAAAGGRGRAHVRPDADDMPMIPEAIEQAAPTRNANAVRKPRSMPATLHVGDVLVSTSAMTMPMTTAPTTARMRDRRVLAPDEGDRALEDRAGHVLHRLGAVSRARTSRAR